ncbi:hypothetical protein QLQ12_06965 [Actinoplanes sp. NEAU-A12]|uniref:Secreted protein n=1 Tax=Actinoplanes sandaracinus TaxID=3045177 RepID=A0ABT6WF29_9ACTN|nr:hypothetical protein [Actinoplanes sandaracinus]MDI6098341.1 hypothetical protein [Actinoplanes sandaracinus]
MKRFGFGLLRVLGVLLAMYLVVRAVAEPFVIDMTDPSTYRDDWGGPSLAGVLAVHCGPGVLAAMFLYGQVVRRITGRELRASPESVPGGRSA